jgi:hypothetical protein
MRKAGPDRAFTTIGSQVQIEPLNKSLGKRRGCLHSFDKTVTPSPI